ncbi:MAG TPA: hypothetical protein VM221_12740 [Armatimonadota bacterium]|nr:hypothetical protein [Armatimonadota bacterium]
MGAAAMAALASMLWPLQVQLGSGGRIADMAWAGLWLWCAGAAPGLVAGAMWAVGGGKVPRARLVLTALGMVFGLAALVWILGPTLFRNPYLNEVTRRLRFGWIPYFSTVIIFNAWFAWIGMLVGRRLGWRVAPTRIAIVGLALAVLLGGFRVCRERLLPGYGVYRLLYRYATARNHRDHSQALTCFTPDYLRRELGAPPYAEKYRRACRIEQASLGADDRVVFCFHDGRPVRSRSVHGGSRRTRIAYHYKTHSQLSGFRWSWDMTVRPAGLRWCIVDLQPTAESQMGFQAFKLAQGPAGTVRILSAPEARAKADEPRQR